MAMECEADELFYGGAAGGGKTELALAISFLNHRKSLILRRQAVELTALEERAKILYGNFGSYNTNKKIWKFPDIQKTIEFGACADIGSETAFQGREHDLIVFDEATAFLSSQVDYITTWLRTTDQEIKPRVIYTGNPPTTVSGEWIIKKFAAWLDQAHPNPAKPHELRWFITINGSDYEVDKDYRESVGGMLVKPKSRTFIPSRVADNNYLNPDYISQLNSKKEPLRSKMLFGDFSILAEDMDHQVIPTQWVFDAQERWRKFDKQDLKKMFAVGVDVARGGEDTTVVTELWNDNYLRIQHVFEGSKTKDGAKIVEIVDKIVQNDAKIKVDSIGCGTSAFDSLIRAYGVNRVIPMVSSAKSGKKDKTRSYKFGNKRAEWWFTLKEMLDPMSNEKVCIPDDPELRRELCAPIYHERDGRVFVESKLDIKKRLRKSIDKADSLIYAICNAKKIIRQNNSDIYIR